ncbi:MAG: ABC transporter permease [Gammaproteobacteria bacterium]|nr:ABC transporter permease [Gammaproteobacteria bacterium]
MLRPLPLAIALRYLRVRRRSRFVSIVAAVAVGGVALAVAALIIVLSVMNGMQGTITQRLLSVNAEVNVSAHGGQALSDVKELATRTAALPEVIASAPYTQRQVVLGHGEALTGARLRGIVPEERDRVNTWQDHMLIGSLEGLAMERYGVILGRDLAVALNVFPGDKVAVIVPRGLVTPIGFIPRMRRFTVVGVFSAGSPRADSGLAITNLAAINTLFGLSGPASLKLKLADPLRAGAVAQKLQALLPENLEVNSWERQHQSLFQALANEQRMLFVLVALAVLIAAFNVLGVLSVLVADKRAEIAVLTSLGLTPRGVLTSFLALGGLIGACGIGLGLLIGLLVAFHVNEIVSSLGQWLGHPLFASGSVRIVGLPSEVMAGQVVGVVVLAAVLVLIAAWLPARRAARMSPVEALSGG